MDISKYLMVVAEMLDDYDEFDQMMAEDAKRERQLEQEDYEKKLRGVDVLPSEQAMDLAQQAFKSLQQQGLLSDIFYSGWEPEYNVYIEPFVPSDPEERKQFHQELGYLIDNDQSLSEALARHP